MDTTTLRKQLLSLQNTETNILIRYVNEETGEIDPEAFKKLEHIGKTKNEIIASATESFHSFLELADLINKKLSRLRELEKIYKTTAESIKKILSQYVPEGEKIYTQDFMINWRKSSILIESEFFDIEDIEKTYPQFVEIKKRLKKADVKNFAKKGGKLPDGLAIVEKQNIQIK